MKTFFLLLISAQLFFCSCAKDSVAPDNSAIQLTGTFRGSVELITPSGNPYIYAQGVRVDVEGTSFSAITDSLGNWEIQNLPTKTYSISFSKKGYSTWKNTSFSFVGGGISPFNTTGKTQLAETATFKIIFDSIVFSVGNGVGRLYSHSNGTKFPSGSKNIYIVNKQKNYLTDPPSIAATLSSTDFINYVVTSHVEYKDSSADFSSSFPINNLGFLTGFHSGDTAYIRAYPCYLVFQYYDITQKNTVYSGCGEGSNILTTVIP